MPTPPFIAEVGQLASRVITTREGATTVFYDPPIVFLKPTWVSYSDDGRVGLYDPDGNLLETVAPSRSEAGAVV